MRRRYVNLKMRGSFRGVHGFRRDSKTGLCKSTVQRQLCKIPAYTYHFPRKFKFPRRRVVVPEIHDQWAADLADIQNISGSNNRKRYSLCVIDIFSKRAWLEAIANKKGPSILEALKKIFKRAGVKPRMIQSDAGGEFWNSHVKAYLKEQGVGLFSVRSELKCCIIERFIRTIKSRIYRYLTHHKTKKFVHRLGDFEKAYNASFHRSINMSPDEVTPENQDLVFHNLYERETPPLYKDSTINKDDRVLVARRRKTFDKSYTPTFLSEVYIVDQVLETTPRVYKLRTKEGDFVSESFYEQQLQVVSHP